MSSAVPASCSGLASRGNTARILAIEDLGSLGYQAALDRQHDLAERRKRGEVSDHLLFVEHLPVVTMGRNGRLENLVSGEAGLAAAGIDFHHTNRGGDVTYHGPGQIVGYPIVDLREWKRDVVAYVRTLEQVLIDALAGFRLECGRVTGMTGVWVVDRGVEKKIAAIGVHISRWVTTHGFALNVSTDLSHFGYIVPCGLTKPVTSMRDLGREAPREDVCRELVAQFVRHFGYAASTENL